MSATTTSSAPPMPERWMLPDHTQLPDKDDSVTNFDEPPQRQILTDSVVPWLQRLHPDGRFAIGQDSGIYWRLTDPPLDGCKAPDWFYIPDVTGDLDGRMRRSSVLWQEYETPIVILEFASGDGTEERDRTPFKGKFWVYERAVKAPYYGIFVLEDNSLEVFHLVGNRYQRMTPNARGRYLIDPLGLELGTWEGAYAGRSTRTWLRWFEPNGALLLHGQEAREAAELVAAAAKQDAAVAKQDAALAKQDAAVAKQDAALAKQQATVAEERAAALAAKLRELGVDPQNL